jgi:hypothetical protein
MTEVGLNQGLEISMSMRRLGFAGLSLLAAVGSFAQMANAETQSFHAPQYKEYLLDWCFTWGADCGQRPADAWCQSKGFDAAKSFGKWENPGKPTKLIGGVSELCNEAECDSYTRITCVSADVEEVTFKRPKFKGTRLDWCLTWGQNCGKPAADAYCERKGYGHATDFAIAENIGLTRIISDRQVCNKPECDGFKAITCAQ